ncbi:MAG: hypothetical protein MUE42_04220 [Opitutaceae bacterium]|jgi:hypothetical protein|nr:hypothetical protein [Opitutaceae bacterium]
MRLPRALAALLPLAAALGVFIWFIHPAEHVSPPPAAPVPPDHAFAPGEPPPLLPPRPATRDQPALAWERLLAADGSAAEDLASLADLVTGYLQSGQDPAQKRPIGFNEDLIPALTDRTALGDAALPSSHPAIRDGKLLDRWGTPWQVHPLAGALIQLRSAGPDRRLYTSDDLVAPPDHAEGEP